MIGYLSIMSILGLLVILSILFTCKCFHLGLRILDSLLHYSMEISLALNIPIVLK